MMGFVVGFFRLGRLIVGAFLDVRKHSFGGDVQFFFRQFSRLDRFDDLSVVGPFAGRHLQVHSGANAFHTVVGRAPVADDEMEDLTGKAGNLPADTTAASGEDDFFIDDTPDEFDDEDEDDEDEDEDIDEEEEEDEDDK